MADDKKETGFADQLTTSFPKFTDLIINGGKSPEKAEEAWLNLINHFATNGNFEAEEIRRHRFNPINVRSNFVQNQRMRDRYYMNATVCLTHLIFKRRVGLLNPFGYTLLICPEFFGLFW